MGHSLKVGIIGAAGNIGRRLTHGLSDRYELRLFDRLAQGGDCAEGVRHLDLTEPQSLAHQLDGLDAIIHLAATHRGDPPFSAVVENNIVATHNLLEEACRAGVKRFVFASTNHVQNGRAVGDLRNISAVSPEFLASGCLISTRDSPAPDSYYGVSKLCCEELGRYYADYRRSLEFVAIRIGWAAPADPAQAPLEKILAKPEVERHYRALFLSERDTVQLFERALLADLRFFVGYGTSANPVAIFDLSDTIERLGYHPLDNSEDYFRAAMTLRHSSSR